MGLMRTLQRWHIRAHEVNVDVQLKLAGLREVDLQTLAHPPQQREGGAAPSLGRSSYG